MDDTYLRKEQKMEESSKTETYWYILLLKEKPKTYVIKNALNLAYCLVLLFYHLHFNMLFTEKSHMLGYIKKLRDRFSPSWHKEPIQRRCSRTGHRNVAIHREAEFPVIHKQKQPLSNFLGPISMRSETAAALVFHSKMQL